MTHFKKGTAAQVPWDTFQDDDDEIDTIDEEASTVYPKQETLGPKAPMQAYNSPLS